MKKIITLIVSFIILATLCGCSIIPEGGSSFCQINASDLLEEDFGIAVTKGNTTLLNEVNKVVDKWVADETLTKYTDYYDQLAAYGEDPTQTKPEAGDLKTTWDFGDATEVLTMYTESGFAPYEFIYNSEIVGIDVAIMSEVAVNMGLKLEIKDVAFDTIPTCVSQSSGNAVGAAGMTITDDRKEIVDFSNVYSSSTLVIVSSGDKAYSKLADLNGLKIGVQEGTSGDLISSAAITAEGYTYETDDGNVTVKIENSTDENVKRYKQYALAFADLKAGRIDAIVMDKLPAIAMLNGIN